MCPSSCRMSEKVFCISINAKNFFKGFVLSTSYEHMFLPTFQGNPASWEPLLCAILISVSLAELFPCMLSRVYIVQKVLFRL